LPTIELVTKSLGVAAPSVCEPLDARLDPPVD